MYNKYKMLKMLYTTVILICNKIKTYLQNLIHKHVEVFSLRSHQTNPISRPFIHDEVRRKQLLHVAVTDRFAIPQNLMYINFHYASLYRS